MLSFHYEIGEVEFLQPWDGHKERIRNILHKLISFGDLVSVKDGAPSNWSRTLEEKGLTLLNKLNLDIVIHQVPPKQASLQFVDDNMKGMANSFRTNITKKLFKSNASRRLYNIAKQQAVDGRPVWKTCSTNTLTAKAMQAQQCLDLQLHQAAQQEVREWVEGKGKDKHYTPNGVKKLYRSFITTKMNVVASNRKLNGAALSRLKDQIERCKNTGKAGKVKGLTTNKLNFKAAIRHAHSLQRW